MRPYRITNTTTWQRTSASTLRGAMKSAARMIASDVEGQVVVIEGPDGTFEARNNGFGIDYQRVA